MESDKPLKKFFLNKSAFIILSVLVAALLFMYICLNLISHQMNIDVSNANLTTDEKYKIVSKCNELQTYSEIILVVFSVGASALLSSLLIEKHNSNKIIEDVFIDDFFTSEKLINLLDENKQKQILKNIEKNLSFDGCKEKSEIYLAIKEKINKPLFKYDLFYESYYINTNCKIKENYIEKSFVRSISIKTFPKSQKINNFVLLSICTPKTYQYTPVEIKSVKIDGKSIEISKIKKNEKNSSSLLDLKKGYNAEFEYIYTKPLDFSNKKAIRIDMEYITRCPINDKVYTSRLPYPCKSFDFNFSLNDTNEYKLNTSAFGFINDASRSPNHSNDDNKIAIKMDEWMFPLDGVCIFIEKKLQN